MKTTFMLIVLLTISVANAQTRQELQNELFDFARKTVMYKSYESYDELWNAIYIVQQKEYPEITRESKDKGYIEARVEKEDYKEKLNIEILGKGPYKLSMTFQSERKDVNGWTKSGQIRDEYALKIYWEIYEQLYGPIQFPAALMEKVAAYNAKQTKDKKKLLPGRDY